MWGWFTNWRKAKSTAAPGSVGYARELLAQAWTEAFRLGRRDRPREHNQPFGYSGDAAIRSSDDLMHRRTRDLTRNNAQAKKIKNSLADLIVGMGMQTFSWPFAPTEMLEIVTELESLQAGELGPRLTFALESDDLFEEWSSDKTQFDAEGRLSWPEMQRMLLGESVEVGNGLMIRCFRKDYSLVPLCYQLIEREQLDLTQDRPASDGKNAIVGGVEFDAHNRTVAYHVFLDHPQDLFGGIMVASGGRRERIVAERVIDLAQYHRPSASLGVTWFDASGQGMWDRDSFMESEIRSSALDAAFALAVFLENDNHEGSLGFDEEGESSSSSPEVRIGHSPIAVRLGKEDKIEMIRATRPNKDAGPFMKLLDRDTAGASGVSYYTATGDYESTNYSSVKAAKQDEDLHIKPKQMWFASHAALRVRKEFNALAAAGGLFQSLSPADFRRQRRTYQRFDAIGNGRDLVDPFKEGEARTTRLRTGMSTFKEECAKSNKHWIRVLMQLAMERKLFAMFGVKLDFSKSGAADALLVADEESANKASQHNQGVES